LIKQNSVEYPKLISQQRPALQRIPIPALDSTPQNLGQQRLGAAGEKPKVKEG
jgi:hypothetical protein